MSDIVKGYRTHLVGTTAVGALVGNRVYFGNLPQNPTYPAVVLHLINTDTQRHLSNAAGLARSIIQTDCHDDTHTGAESLSETVRVATEHYTGAWGSETVRSAYVTSRRDLSEPPVDGSQLFRRVRSMEVAVWHTEALPST